MSRYIPTGNERLCIPTIREEDGSIESINIALMKLDGLLELSGLGNEPLISCPGMQREAGEWRWTFREDWIPEFRHAVRSDGSGVVCAPPGENFAFYRAPREIGSAFRIAVGDVYQTANIRHRIPRCEFSVRLFGWANESGIMIDVFAGSLLASFAFHVPGGARYFIEGGKGLEELTASGGFDTCGPFRLQVQCTNEPLLAIGANLSSVGAMSAALEAGRIPVDEWLRRGERWLADRRNRVAGDPELERKANRNGHFARFFAMAETLDTGETVSMTSRSHRYYVSSAFWDRDSLLWLYPFLVRNDRAAGEALLRYAFGRQLADAGIHSRYISGRVLEFGFELDELLAPLVALGTWLRLYPDALIGEEPSIQAGIHSLIDRLRAWKHAPSGLYRTELMPTDDRIEGGRELLTYNNALLVHALNACLPLFDRTDRKLASLARSEIPAVSDAIRKHLIRDGMYVWSMNEQGEAEIYDEAAGSLLLLPYYGFCDRQDPAYRKTVDYFYSSQYPYFRPGRFGELGNRHTGTPHPWVLSACNSVLSGVRTKEGLDFLRRAPMDNGIACEAVNVETGEPETGYHFATCAGFVAHAIGVGAGA